MSGSYNVAPDSSYPTKSVRMIVPFAPGGLTDVVGRIYAQALSGSLRQPFIIENRPGAGGLPGVEAAVRSPSDGYNLLIGSTSMSVAPGIYSRIAFDPQKDLASIALIAESPLVLVVPANGPSSVQDLVSRGRGGSVSYATAGIGSVAHLAGELFRLRTGTQYTHIPYKGTGPALADLLAGQTQFMFADPASVTTFVTNGRLRVLGVASSQRNPIMPGVPTLAESGVSGVEASAWIGLFAPSGTPGGILSRLYQALVQAASQSDVAGRITSFGMVARVLPPNDTQAFVQSETDKWSQVARAANIRAD
jgi:tripartite-type tricarboxylate transporter receptor subunit TctC